MTTTEKEFDSIYSAFILADKYKLSVEVFHTALTYMKSNPTKSIQDAVDYGLSEWIK